MMNGKLHTRVLVLIIASYLFRLILAFLTTSAFSQATSLFPQSLVSQNILISLSSPEKYYNDFDFLQS